MTKEHRNTRVGGRQWFKAEDKMHSEINRKPIKTSTGRKAGTRIELIDGKWQKVSR